MTYEALSAKYQLNAFELALCRGGDTGMTVSDEASVRAATLLLLRDAGLDRAGIESYFRAHSCSCGRAIQKQILRALRDALLDSIHDKQRLLDKIDCLLCGLAKGDKPLS